MPQQSVAIVGRRCRWEFQGVLPKSMGGCKVKVAKDSRRSAGPRPLFLLPPTRAPAVDTFGEEHAEAGGLGEKMLVQKREKGGGSEGTQTGGQ